MESPNSAVAFHEACASPVPGAYERNFLSPRKHLSGYTGHVDYERSEEGRDGILKPVAKEGIIGHSGHYLGKVNGVLGKVNVHKGPLSEPQNESPFHNYRANNYALEKADSKSIRKAALRKAKGYPGLIANPQSYLDRLLDELEENIKCRYPNPASARTKIKGTFEVDCSECSIKEFRNSLLHMNFTFIEDQFELLVYVFAAEDPSLVRHMDFIKVVAPYLKYL